MGSTPITTLIFDVDDTLYDVGSGFTGHRNGDAVGNFMVSELGFASIDAAMQVRDEYFEKYHATAKALTVAEADGRLPDGAHFETQSLAKWWASKLEFEKYLKPDPELIAALHASPLKLIAFTNAPRLYAIRVLETLGLREFFPDSQLFAVDDVLPHCKPEPAAFEKVLTAIGSTAAECVMVEDSMKNIRAAKALGMRTLLVQGKGTGDVAASEATKPGDAPQAGDPSVDAAVRSCGELRSALPKLWGAPATFG